MRFAIFALIFTVMAAAVHTVSANIVSMNVTGGEPLQPGKEFEVTFATRNSLTNNEQYYVIFALHAGQVYDKTIGAQPFANRDISSIPKGGKNFTLTLTAPDYFASDAKQQNLTAAVFSQTGASGGVSLLFFRDVVNTAS